MRVSKGKCHGAQVGFTGFLGNSLTVAALYERPGGQAGGRGRTSFAFPYHAAFVCCCSSEARPISLWLAGDTLHCTAVRM
jgi:hypothetical protein